MLLEAAVLMSGRCVGMVDEAGGFGRADDDGDEEATWDSAALTVSGLVSCLISLASAISTSSDPMVLRLLLETAATAGAILEDDRVRMSSGGIAASTTDLGMGPGTSAAVEAILVVRGRKQVQTQCCAFKSQLRNCRRLGWDHNEHDVVYYMAL